MPAQCIRGPNAPPTQGPYGRPGSSRSGPCSLEKGAFYNAHGLAMACPPSPTSSTSSSDDSSSSFDYIPRSSPATYQTESYAKPKPPCPRLMLAQSQFRANIAHTTAAAAEQAPAPPPPQHRAHQKMRWHLPLAFLEQYGTVKDNLGSGGSGHIFSAIRRKDRKEVAVKILPRACVPPNAWVRDAQYGRIPREVAVLKNVKHPNAIDFFDLFEEDDFFLIVMEVFGGSWRASTVRSSDPNPLPLACRPARTRAMDLFELLEVRHLNEDEARIIFLQVVHCIDHMISTHHIVHGDIKDENILIDWTGDEPLAKLIDFGGTIDVAMRRMCGQADFHGTLEFAPPEVILGQAYDPEKAETWSLGVLLYGMINKGHGPFASPEATAFAGYRAIPCSASCSDLIASLLQKKQRYRATIKDILRHPWLSATKPRCPV